jgi:DNA-binding response OmpR family regulator
LKILIIDDDIESSHVLTAKLKKLGHEVKHVVDGTKALGYINIAEDLDLVLLDIIMPKISGFETLTEIRKTTSALELPILMLTSADNVIDVVTSLKAGANDFLMKPVNIELAIARMETQFSAAQLYKEHLIKESFESINHIAQICNDKLNDPLTVINLYIRKIKKNRIIIDTPLIEKMTHQLNRISNIVKEAERITEEKNLEVRDTIKKQIKIS